MDTHITRARSAARGDIEEMTSHVDSALGIARRLRRDGVDDPYVDFIIWALELTVRAGLRGDHEAAWRLLDLAHNLPMAIDDTEGFESERWVEMDVEPHLASLPVDVAREIDLRVRALGCGVEKSRP